ncbi:ABC transporter ATP-binding protein [Tetragenococcus koreensis]|uniref:Multidrug ABC transporter ATP-binding and permease protein n=1 Tax=Tetragenococcus koreensis TaxID=290335 RepID=A0AAN4UBV7_9ENTE|nr:ABC transporter ATP-binding protein [Tetragenococcus koreensis]AYW46447.1 sugar ABC transporter ATP-binding protein [Tetragenococcus koreensis]MCF1585068.1 ABC transporter ATP-binding protein/permease [Tetragenococcus koreensis]MCF1629404.1 ABC transporter ATP-binding protein/permease [Tetragenococcus koreensis]MDN6253996.1 ABC transporter ATP-binding protein/permease [Tetragenococcus koreensis]MDN6290515.1 ABC transporter ATP-binding protein/permease [Tetragenococcus koreensis]
MKTKSLDWTSFRRFLSYLAKYKKENWLAVLFGLIAGSTTVYITYLIGRGVDQLVGENQVHFTGLFKIGGLFAGIVLLTVVSQWLIQRLGNKVAYWAVADLRKDAFSHLNRLPLRYYDQTSHGNIVSHFTNDMDNISIAVSQIFNQLFAGMSVVLLALFMMLRMSVVLTIVVLVSTPIIFLVSYLVARSSQANFAAQQEIVGTVSGFVTEMVGNQKIVKAFQQEENNQEQFEKINQELYVKGQKAQFSSSLSNPLSRFVDHLAYLAVGFTGGYLILSGSELVTIGVVSSFTIYSTQFTKPFIEISGVMTQIQMALAGLTRTFDLLDKKEEDSDADKQDLPTIKGEIQFNYVDFSYENGQSLIEDFNFTAKPGETIAIVGKTGAGKSTLVNLLMRFYEVDSGEILLDGLNIDDIKRDQLRKSFGMVLQDTWLFDATLRENLTYGNEAASDKEIYTALQKAYMYDYVMRLPHGLDTSIGHHGIKISDGQRQLLTIARTMVSEPPMLILDEATSSVDTLTEQKIQSAFLEMMEGRTSFVIAHRLSTIQSADKILVMENGQIVEAGTHEDLLEKKGYYEQLYRVQFEE